MPLPPPVIGSLIEAGGNVSSGIIGTIGSLLTQKKQMRYNEKLYNRQRSDALSDWERQNAYDSPLSQMTRYKEAGLNPHLIYGQQSNGASVRSTDFKAADLENPAAPLAEGVMRAGPAVANMYNLEQMAAQTNNLRKQNEIMEQDRQLRAAQVAGQQIGNMISATRNSRESLDFHQAEKLNPISLTAAEQAVRKTAADITATTDANQRANELHPGNLKQQLATIAQTAASTVATEAQRKNVVQNTQNLMKEGVLKQLEINLRQIGVNPNDPQWQRILGQLLSKVLPGNPVDALTNEAKKLVK